MAWYLWLYIAIAIVWFIDMYAATIRATPPNLYGDLVAKPILIAILSSVWPLTFLYFRWKSRPEKKKAVSSD